jgi:methanogenic corrinoid protein MtbC1
MIYLPVAQSIKELHLTRGISTALVELARDEVAETIGRRLAAGDDPLALLGECRDGMALVGERFQAGDYYLSELLLSAEIFKAAAARIEPHLPAARGEMSAGSVVLATMRGDIHDLGKNLLATLLRAHAFEVRDLGVNVEPAELLAAVAETRPDFVGFSALITTSFESIRDACRRIDAAGLRGSLEILVGGGVTTPELRDWVGADYHTLDAASGVDYCRARMRNE